METHFNPLLKNIPMAVCGSAQDRHGIVLAKNEEAKKYGIKTAETTWEALLKCPKLTVVEPHYERYLDFSRRVRAIYEDYTDLVEPFGIDECWLDVTGSVYLYGSGEKIAHEIRQRVKKEIGVTLSAGVSFNKIFAKLGSDMKKPDAVTVISKEGFREKIWGLKAEEMIGIGKATKKRLNSIGIYTLGDLAGADESVLRLVFGKLGTEIWKNANGLNDSPVLSKNQLPPAKSFGRSVTCKRDLLNDDDVKSVMLYLSDQVAASLRENACYCCVVQITVRDEHLVVREKQLTLPQPTRLVEVIHESAMQLFRQCWSWETKVRSVGVRACELTGEDGNFQYSLFCNAAHLEKLERLENQVEKIRQKYGSQSIFRGGTMTAPLTSQGIGFHQTGADLVSVSYLA